MSIVLILNCITPIFSLIGMTMIGHKNKYGFLVFLAVEASLAYIGYCTKQYGLIIMGGLYFLTDIYAYYMWHKEQKKLDDFEIIHKEKRHHDY